jgi:hypothetical protein
VLLPLLVGIGLALLAGVAIYARVRAQQRSASAETQSTGAGA